MSIPVKVTVKHYGKVVQERSYDHLTESSYVPVGFYRKKVETVLYDFEHWIHFPSMYKLIETLIDNNQPKYVLIVEDDAGNIMNEFIVEKI